MQEGGTRGLGYSRSSEACRLQALSCEKVKHELGLTNNENEELIMVSSSESALIPDSPSFFNKQS